MDLQAVWPPALVKAEVALAAALLGARACLPDLLAVRVGSAQILGHPPPLVAFGGPGRRRFLGRQGRLSFAG